MSHTIHHTEGLVLSGVNTREADRYLTIFTKDFGMVRAQAQGVRKITSKLRYSLQDFSYTKIDLVRGREKWRITNATKIKSFNNITQTPFTFQILGNISKLLKRLVPGEEKNEPLFNHIIATFSFLNEGGLTMAEWKDMELVIVLRILYHLGYVGGDENEEAVTSAFIDKSLLESIRPQRKKILAEINKSLEESQL